MRRSTKVAGTVAICATIIVLGFAAYVIAKNQLQESGGADATSAPSQSYTQNESTRPAETASGVILTISEDKTGWSIAGEELPAQHMEQEFTVAKGDKIYEGLTQKAGDSSRCILTITEISDETITVEMLLDGQETVKDIAYNKEAVFTAYTNPDEYSYVFTIKFVK